MTKLAELANTTWVGTSELWLDPENNVGITAPCSIEVTPGTITYRWSYEGKPQTGTLVLRDDGGLAFTDTWHMPGGMAMSANAGTWAMVDATGTYPAGDGPPWGWRIYVSRRPDSDELVLQMTNICPWGEDGRAVRMTCKRA